MMVRVPFDGFYYSISDDVLEHSIDVYDTTEEFIAEHDRIDWLAYQKWAVRRQVERLADELGLPSLAYHELWSPKEYNFMTDEIFATIDDEDFDRLVALALRNPGPLEAWVHEVGTPRDGYRPFYPGELDDWLDEAPPQQWEACRTAGLFLSHPLWKDEFEHLDEDAEWVVPMECYRNEYA